MNEAILTRTLRQYRKVRGPDFHQPATRQNQGKLENGDGLEKVIEVSPVIYHGYGRRDFVLS